MGITKSSPLSMMLKFQNVVTLQHFQRFLLSSILLSFHVLIHALLKKVTLKHAACPQILIIVPKKNHRRNPRLLLQIVRSPVLMARMVIFVSRKIILAEKMALVLMSVITQLVMGTRHSVYLKQTQMSWPSTRRIIADPVSVALVKKHPGRRLDCITIHKKSYVKEQH